MDAITARLHSRLQRQLLYPFSGGILSFALSVALWFSVFMLGLLLMKVDEHLAAQAQVNGSAAGLEALAHSTGLYSLSGMLAKATGLTILQAAFTLLAVGMAFAMTLIGGFVGWMWITTVAAVGSTWHALNGQSSSKREKIMAALNSGLLLGFLLALYGWQIWPFAVWEALLLCGVAAAILRLWQPAKREFFGADARGELAEAWREGKLLGFVLLTMLGISLAGHAAIAALPPQWMLLVTLSAAGLLLWFVLLIEAHVKKAIAIALHERKVHRIRNGGT